MAATRRVRSTVGVALATDTVPGGHCVVSEYPDRIAPLVIDFVDAHPADPAARPTS